MREVADEVAALAEGQAAIAKAVASSQREWRWRGWAGLG